MYSKYTTNCQHFSQLTHHETKALHPCATAYRADEDTTALILALTGIGLMVVTIVSMLITFRVL